MSTVVAPHCEGFVAFEVPTSAQVGVLAEGDTTVVTPLHTTEAVVSAVTGAPGAEGPAAPAGAFNWNSTNW